MADQPVDVIHADQTSMAQYAQFALAWAPKDTSRPSMVLDAHNALFRVFEQLAVEERQPLKQALLRHEARALERYEQRIYVAFDHVVFVNDEDRMRLGRALLPERRTTTIPICIDPRERPLVACNPEQRTVTHLGTMFWPPNVDGVLWFARQVWPLVLQRAPDARLVVMGKRPPASVQALPANCPSIEVLGYVPDPKPYLQETAAFIVPLWAGAGMRVKIIDAWCWGLPIVSTTLGAEGIAVRDGEDILIADEPAAFANAIMRLLTDPTLRARLRENGRAKVMERYDWRHVYQEWDGVYGAVQGQQWAEPKRYM
jgi:polysaccharide biosynthesis protein PslH